MKIVLANTVGIDSGGWSVIPYASRWTTASMGHSEAFTYYPRDLGYLSALLKRDTPHKIKLVDGCLERYDRERYAEVLIGEKPDWLVIENSTRTFADDEWIARAVKDATGAGIMITGQHVSALPGEGLAFADVVAKGEYLRSALDFFRNGQDGRRVLEPDRPGLIDVSTLPFPEDDDVSRYDYALKADNVCEWRQIQVYTSRGCPYHCSYCVARHLYYEKPSWRARPVDNVVEELRHLAGKYTGLEGFFFDDEIHNARISYVKDLARAIISAGLNGYKYEAMCAYAPFDDESLELMREAGYYKVRVGIETASDSVAEGLALKGKHRPDRLHSFLGKARDVGIKVYGTFTLGGRGATEEEDGKTIALMADLVASGLLDDCQVSICTPQPGVPFYEWGRDEGIIDTGSWSRFDGGEDAVLSLPGYSAERIKATRQKALEAYDEARRTRDSAIFRRNWDRETSSAGIDPERLLLFRSSRDWSLDSLLGAVFDTWSCKVAFLCHSDRVRRFTNAHPKIIPIAAGDGGFLNWETLGEKARRELIAYRADTALIPANTLHCRGYGNVVDIAKKSGARRILFVDAAGRLKDADS